MGPIESIICQKLEKAFSPDVLEVTNESASHNVPEGSESHFKVVVVASDFQGKSAVKRHQAIYGLLADELKSAIHALSLYTYMPDEWEQLKAVPQSPKCLAGERTL